MSPQNLMAAATMEYITVTIGVTIVLILLLNGILDLLTLLRALFELPGQIVFKIIEFIRRIRIR